MKDPSKKHSGFTGFPIELYVEKSKEKEATDSEEDEEENKDEGGKEGNEPKVEEVDEEKEKDEKNEKTKTVKEVSNEWEQLNKNKTSLVAEFGGCDERRARIVLQIVV